MEPILQADGIHYEYSKKIVALSGVSLTIGRGERVAVIGANGCGKTTLLQILDGLLFPSGGSVRFREQAVNEASLRSPEFLRFFRERVGYVFQDPDVQLFCPTVMDELLYGPLQLDLTEAEAKERACDVLGLLELDDRGDRPTTMLSGGEKKRVAIGSVLTMNPEVLLLDEPTNGLDPRSQAFLVELLLSLNEEGRTLVVATHDMALVQDLDMKVAILSEDHRVETVGPAVDILEDQELLLRMNLIHEHRHPHGPRTHRHRHAHFLMHRHDPDDEKQSR